MLSLLMKFSSNCYLIESTNMNIMNKKIFIWKKKIVVGKIVQLSPNKYVRINIYNIIQYMFDFNNKIWLIIKLYDYVL